ncbi:uncharacterized protein FIBRA_07031 [Fibroporia radiculosa]|uniref:DNA replication factor Cdt1 C-terminal domain-containing protein n=1 Tax=Fibroporia radiculosa TaxID=599839 RepID=J4GD84_9APHY|nr:uncharacterized protein FIBRA_07031 [Fibroporia radiculosa]CCM04838.1 predicted protein [Fibroporia radiculosa]
MSNLYASLRVSPRKKRAHIELDDDVLTPKKLRIAPPTPPSTVTRQKFKADGPGLPSSLSRLYNIHTALQQALSHALASCAVAPSEDTGVIRNVLNHISLTTYSGFNTKFDTDDIKRLCWLWEWDGKDVPTMKAADKGDTKSDGNDFSKNTDTLASSSKATTLREKSLMNEDDNPFLDWTPKAFTKNPTFATDDDENPFLDNRISPRKSSPKAMIALSEDDDNPFLENRPEKSSSKDWTRGGAGFVISQTSHYSKAVAARVPVYGIGIEVEMDIDKGMGGGMAAVARWTAASETRRKEILRKLECWYKLHSDEGSVPNIPLADLPSLPATTRPSTLTRLLASSSPKSPSSASILASPSSPTRSPSKTPFRSPTKKHHEFAVPFPITPSSKTGTPSKNSVFFPQTPSRRERADSLLSLLTPSSSHSPSRSSLLATPTSSRTSSLSGRSTPTPGNAPSVPSTPTHQRGGDAATAPQTPTSSRRQALYERIRQRSLTASPTKGRATGDAASGKMTKDQLLKLSQEETRRRCILGRLGGVAESVWMLFSNSSSSASGSTSRKRRALPTPEIVAAVLKSSPVPISAAEAQESLNLLAKLCPFFLRPLNIAGSEWLEMPAPSSIAETGGLGGSPTKTPNSPGRLKGKDQSAEELRTRSPRRVQRDGGGLREVRERIRRELELTD